MGWKPCVAKLLICGTVACPCFAGASASADELPEMEDIVSLDLEEDEQYSEDLEIQEILVDDVYTVSDRMPGQAEILEGTGALATTLEEALGMQSGLSVQHYGTELHQQSLSMRGAAAQDVLVLLNHTPVNALSHGQAELAFLPLGQLSSATVWLNGGALENGSGALGGTLSLSTIPIDESNAYPVLKAGIYGGSMSTYGVHGVGKTKIHQTVFQGGAFADATDGRFVYEDAQGSIQTREHNGAMRLGGQMAVVHPFDRGIFEFSHLSSGIQREIAGPSEFPDNYRDAGSEHYLGVTNFHFVSSGMEAWPLHFFQFEANLSHKLAWDNYENPTALLGGEPYWSEQTENALYAEAAVRLLAGSFSVTSLALGYQFGHLNRHGESEGSVWENRIYGRADQTFYWLAGTLRLQAGARLEGTVGRLPHVIPQVALAYAPVDFFDFDVRIGYAYREPTFDEKYMQTEFIRGNANLKAQRAVQSEIGLHFRPIAGLQANVSLFWNEHWDMIRFLPISVHLYAAKNLSEVTSRGVESLLKYEYREFFGVAFGYTFTDSFLHGATAHALPDMPRHRLSAQVWGKTPHFMGLVALQYTLDTPQDMFGHLRKPDPLQLNARLALLPGDHWGVSLEVRNMLNARNYADVLQFPLPGLTAMLMLEIR